MNNELIEAAKAVIARWDSTDWKVAPVTAEGMDRLRNALLAKPEPCCGEYATCLRACTPRGRWLQFQSTAKLPEVEEWLAKYCRIYINFGPAGQAEGIRAVCDGDVEDYIAKLTAAHAAELADLRQQMRDSKDWERNTAEENVRLVGVIARKNGAEELAEAKGRREALMGVPVDALNHASFVILHCGCGECDKYRKPLDKLIESASAAQQETP